jgi:uncharacterized protein
MVDMRTSDRPAEVDFHLFDSGNGLHVLVVDGSQIYAIDEELAAPVRIAAASGSQGLQALLATHGIRRQGLIGNGLIESAPVRALSLAIAERCNLGCLYCYAQGGNFGGPDRTMAWDVAKSSLGRLFADSRRGERVNLAFLGGEPLVNRKLLRRTTALAARFARRRHVPIGFSITTNGTLLTREDGEFFERYGFAVTVSLDGVGDAHDDLRPTKGGAGTYAQIITNVRPLLAMQRRMQVSARVTVTPKNLALRQTLDQFVDLGFHSVGFSPMLRSPTGQGQMETADLASLLEQMMDCGQEFERRTAAGERYSFANLLTALQQIHRGTHRPYPCGAGAGYFGVSATGGLFACHRFVGDPAGAMGDVEGGVEPDAQRRWLAERAVDRQEPCRSCWARYLCGGGCHYEVMHRGRPACDYIRGWLDYALGAYARLSARCPGFIAALTR